MQMMSRNQTSQRQQLLCQISQVSFAVDDMLLYLDTHPCDEKALAFINEHIEQRNSLMAEYSKAYGPLTPKGFPEVCDDTWKWAEQPFPWEREGVCR